MGKRSTRFEWRDTNRFGAQNMGEGPVRDFLETEGSAMKIEDEVGRFKRLKKLNDQATQHALCVGEEFGCTNEYFQKGGLPPYEVRAAFLYVSELNQLVRSLMPDLVRKLGEQGLTANQIARRTKIAICYVRQFLEESGAKGEAGPQTSL